MIVARAALCSAFIGLTNTALASDAQDQCATAATREYAEAMVKNGEAARQKSTFLTIQEVVEKRRLQETYCLKFSACLRPAGVDDARAALEGAIHFTKCIDDEEEEDVLSRLRDADAKEREQAISRLRGD
jgi:uncharacterized protein YnzC (UPF0291/DUF896 family)